MVVVDASALVNALLPTPRRFEIVRRLTVAGGSVHAPEIVDVEVAHTLRRMEREGRFARSAGHALLDAYRLFAVRRHGHERFLRRIWDLRHNLTADDAAYVALAEALDAVLLTSDARLAASTGHTATIELV